MRPMHRSRLLLLVTLLASTACQSPAPQTPPPPPVAPAPVVVPSPTPVAVRSVATARGSGLAQMGVPIEQVLARSAETGKPALLYFCASWCGYCSKMNRETLSRPEVQSHLASAFVAVEYDVDTQLGRALADRYGARGFPTMVIVDASGQATQTIVGARQPQAFLSLLGAR